MCVLVINECLRSSTKVDMYVDIKDTIFWGIATYMYIRTQVLQIDTWQNVECSELTMECLKAHTSYHWRLPFRADWM